METLHLVELKKMPIYRMLSLEEHLLEQPLKNYLLINYGTPEAIVLGKSNNRDELIVESPEVPLIRRFSGGGTVFVDESTLFVTWILSKELEQARCVDTLFDWTISLLQQAHPHLELKRIETDYVLKDRKIGGTAQYVKKDRILHHTSFLFDYSPEKMALLKAPTKAPLYRQNRPHSEFITRLKDHFPSSEAFINPFLKTLESSFTLEPTSILELLEEAQKTKQTTYIF
ncbi:MAG: lipoate--protein ligase family protein [Chlamydiia bacterium]